MKVMLKAHTNFGLGGKEFWTETYLIKDFNDTSIKNLKRDFAVKYGVMIDNVDSVEVISDEHDTDVPNTVNVI